MSAPIESTTKKPAEISETMEKKVKIFTGKSPWNTISVVFNTLGILVGLAIFALGFSKAFHLVDSIWLSYLGEHKIFVVSQKKSAPTALKDFYHTTFQIPATPKSKSVNVTIDHKELYEYIKKHINPASDRRVEAILVRRNLSRSYSLAKVGRIRITKPPKSAELIFYLGVMVLGGLVAFSATKELRKRWLRRGVRG